MTTLMLLGNALSSSKVDLRGGYYDAGDNIKFGFPMAFTTTMLAWSVIDFGRTMGSELGHAVRAVKWGTDYLLKATATDGVVYVQVGDAISDHNCWERPEDMDTLRTVYKIDRNHPGSVVAGETAAASIVFRSRDPGRPLGGGSNITSLSFLLLAYSNYLSHANHVVTCGGKSASPALLKNLARRQVNYILGDNPMKMSYMVGYGALLPTKDSPQGQFVTLR
ncbi:hypothetical protein L1987_38768 [Smallanthus sonchifolius]|uniref:Uncharacterized protein n=1 Tax=Smallanthus sonchifolius TaxID=185202 RepID=A0ACB9HJK1_9ASTR|nr:hypothetical protein L1987_38768 [Smallanthus sonchifolius]